MSDWEKLVNDILVNPKGGVRCSDNAGIYDLDGVPLSQSKHFNSTEKEVKDAVAAIYKESGRAVYIGDTKYIVLRTDGDHLMAKSLRKGMTVAKGKKFVVIGQYEDDKVIMPGNNCQRVCTVRDYISSIGY